MIQNFDSSGKLNPKSHGEIPKCQGGTALPQPVTITGSTGEEGWKHMLSTSNLQLQIKDFLWSSDMSGSSYIYWPSSFNIYYQVCLNSDLQFVSAKHIKDCKGPTFSASGDRWDTRKCKSPPQFLFQMCLFRIMSNVPYHSSFQKISLWPTPVETEAKSKGQTWQVFQMPAKNKQISQSLSHF